MCLFSLTFKYNIRQGSFPLKHTNSSQSEPMKTDNWQTSGQWQDTLVHIHINEPGRSKDNKDKKYLRNANQLIYELWHVISNNVAFWQV